MAAGNRIADALRRVPDLRVAAGLGRAIVPPTAVVGPPELKFEGLEPSPTRGSWPVYLVVGSTEFATDQLLELLEPVAEAINEHSGGVVTKAEPGVYPGANQVDLPAYMLTVQAVLSLR